MLELSLVSGVAVPTIYQYFDSKEDVFQQWFARLGSEVFEDLLNKALNQKDADVVNYYLAEALKLIVEQRAVVRVLLNEFPQALSVQLISDLEEQTQAFVSKLLFFDNEQIKNPRLKLLTRLLLGYMLQVVFYSERELDIAFEAGELSKITNFYLGQLVL
jgi:AcrR family transcriptional regulator